MSFDDTSDPASTYRTFGDVKENTSTSTIYYETVAPKLFYTELFKLDTSERQDAIPVTDTSVHVQRKRIIICCDGTWQSSVTGLKNIPSNVTRLARSIARSAKDTDDSIWQQIVYYDAGIGSGEVGVIESARAGGFGIGFVGNVVEAYSFIVNNYRLGDKVYCFGFSRGAYTARAVAGLVTDIGIIRPEDLHDFPDLFEHYQKHDDSFAFRQSEHYREWLAGSNTSKHMRKAPPECSRVIEIVGVFDTVGSLGIPELTYTQSALRWAGKQMGWKRGDFHNIGLSPFIKHAFHALALDERRKPFTPSLWQYPTEKELSPPEPAESTEHLQELYNFLLKSYDGTNKEHKTRLKETWEALVGAEMYDQLMGTRPNQLNGVKPDLQQVWFPGVHINVGGGDNSALNGQECDYEQIALISFAWMCERISPFIQLESEKGDLQSFARGAMRDRANIVLSATTEKNYGSNAVSKGFWKGLEAVGASRIPLRTVPDHIENGWARGIIVDSFAGMMKLGKSLNRTPGEYKHDHAGNKPGDTFESIHPTVAFRKQSVTGYNPPALKGFTRSNAPVLDSLTGERRYEWKKGEVIVPEFVIDKKEVFSRLLAAKDKMAETFLRNIDEELHMDKTVS